MTGAEGRRARLDWRDDSGKLRLGGLLALILVGVGVYVGAKVVPIYASKIQLTDTIREQVVFAGARRRQMGDAEVLRNILERAEYLGIPITARNVVIRRPSGRIRIRVVYQSTVDFVGGYSHTWTFDLNHEGPSF